MQTPEVETHESLMVDVSARQLRAFATVADTLSYAEAAELLHYTEPGVFAQVKRLECVIGCRLLVRHGRGLRLTAEGTALLPACRSALHGIERMDNIRTRLLQSTRIVVASGSVTGSYLLPSIIKAFGQKEPNISVDLRIGVGQELIDFVATGVADVAVSGTLDRYALPESLNLIHWFEEPHALFTSAAVSPTFAPPILIYALGGATGPVRLLQERFKELRISEYQMHFLSSPDAVKGACLAGLGYALLPCRAAGLESRTGLLREVKDFSGRIAGHVWICRPAAEILTAQVQSFLRFLQESGPMV